MALFLSNVPHPTFKRDMHATHACDLIVAMEAIFVGCRWQASKRGPMGTL